MVKARGDALTREIFEWQPPQVAIGYAAEVAGKGPLDNRIARELSQALRDAKDEGLSRAEIAERMSTDLGRKISEDMLDKWAGEASQGHRISLDAFIALIRATRKTDLVGLIARQFDLVVVESRFEGLIQLQLIEEHERDVAAHKAKIIAEQRHRR